MFLIEVVVNGECFLERTKAKVGGLSELWVVLAFVTNTQGNAAIWAHMGWLSGYVLLIYFWKILIRIFPPVHHNLRVTWFRLWLGSNSRILHLKCEDVAIINSRFGHNRRSSTGSNIGFVEWRDAITVGCGSFTRERSTFNAWCVTIILIIWQELSGWCISQILILIIHYGFYQLNWTV